MCEAMRRLMKDEIEDEVNSAVTIAEKKAKLEEKKDMAVSLSRMGISIDKIAEAAKVSVAMVQEWLSGSMPPVK